MYYSFYFTIMILISLTHACNSKEVLVVCSIRSIIIQPHTWIPPPPPHYHDQPQLLAYIHKSAVSFVLAKCFSLSNWPSTCNTNRAQDMCTCRWHVQNYPTLESGVGCDDTNVSFVGTVNKAVQGVSTISNDFPWLWCRPTSRLKWLCICSTGASSHELNNNQWTYKHRWMAVSIMTSE